MIKSAILQSLLEAAEKGIVWTDTLENSVSEIHKT